jgi:hypothetical protein
MVSTVPNPKNPMDKDNELAVKVEFDGSMDSA